MVEDEMPRGLRAYIETVPDRNGEGPLPPAWDILERIEPLPLTEVLDEVWMAEVHATLRLCRFIDRHLNTEERGRNMPYGERLTPIGLCPEQRVNMVTDALAACQ